MWLDDVPDIFDSIAELSASYTGAQAIIADADGVVLEAIGKIIVPFGHCTDENANALLGSYIFYVVLDPNDIRIEAERDLTAIGGKMVGDWILDDFE